MKLNCKEIFDKIEEAVTVRAIRDGLVMAIPVLMIGSLALIFKTLPIVRYQQWLQDFNSGILYDLFSGIYDATFGFLSFYMTLTISVSLTRVKETNKDTVGAPLTALICFLLISGIFIETPEAVIDNFGVNSMFPAIIISVASTHLYFFIKKRMKFKYQLFSDGADIVFSDTVFAIVPSLSVVSTVSILNLIIVQYSGSNSFTFLITKTLNTLFSHMDYSFASALLFVFVSSLLWFFGIHGSNFLEGVNDSLFGSAIQENITQLMAGLPATEIFSKTFLDVFVLIGGCGSSLCLLAAILLFSKQRSNRQLANLAVFPMLFNINELMIFGLPVAFNPILFLPFILTPIASLVTAYIAVKTGIVPVATVQVEWTTPIFLGGYLATGSIAGSILQLVNLIVGTLIYRPFVKLYDRDKIIASCRNMEALQALFKKSEESNVPIVLTEMRDSAGAMARMLVGELRYTIDKNKFSMYYQPQHDQTGKCIGAEALLRWKHPVFGMIYPPLVIKLAEEAQLLEELEKSIFRMVVRHMDQINQENQKNYGLCVNISAQTIQNQAFISFLREFTKENSIQKGRLCIEITEKDTLMLDESLYNTLAEIHELGYLLAIDDFSMGATSIKYLQNNQFDLVKLDGNLVRQIDTNIRSKNIVASIIYLADSLGFNVLAEYVEDREKQVALEKIGCLRYQGLLYSPAIPIEDFINYLKKH
ncbi:MAG: EAL domain-containing protein [Clostridiales bacterium]|nr:EAL domain-containing protein [Clostridiales bacterium]